MWRVLKRDAARAVKSIKGTIEVYLREPKLDRFLARTKKKRKEKIYRPTLMVDQYYCPPVSLVGGSSASPSVSASVTPPVSLVVVGSPAVGVGSTWTDVLSDAV